MATGKVKMWNFEKGYGFITPLISGPDVFVHVSVCQRANIDDLTVGEMVEYETGADPKTGKTRCSAIRMA